MSIASLVLTAVLGCAAGSSDSPAVADSVDVAEIMSGGGRLIDLDLVEQLYRRVFYEVNAPSLGACFISVGRDTLGEAVDPPAELLERLSDTGVDVRAWSRHEREGWAAPVRDKDTGELGATCSVELLRQSTPPTYAFGVRVFPRRSDERILTLIAKRVGGKWEVALYAPMFD